MYLWLAGSVNSIIWYRESPVRRNIVRTYSLLLLNACSSSSLWQIISSSTFSRIQPILVSKFLSDEDEALRSGPNIETHTQGSTMSVLTYHLLKYFLPYFYIILLLRWIVFQPPFYIILCTTYDQVNTIQLLYEIL